MSDTGKIIALAKAVAGGSSAEIEAEVNELKSQITVKKGSADNSAVLDGEYYGYSNNASDVFAFAHGVGNSAFGKISHAEGLLTKAIGQNSHSEGSTSVAYGSTSHAEGSAVALGQSSHAEGSSGPSRTISITGAENATTYTVTSGNVTADDNNSTIICKKEYRNVVSVDTVNNTITLDSSFGEELSNESCNLYYGNAVGVASHTEGVGTTTKGYASHAEGAYNNPGAKLPTWSANTSYAVGDRVLKSGSGYICIEANSDSSWDASKWAFAYVNFNHLLTVGNGYGNNNRSNAFAVDVYGNGHFNGDVYVGCNANSTGGTSLTEAVNGKVNEPSSEGTSGQVLTTDGNGGRSWTTVQGGGGGGVSDVKVDGTSVVTSGVANIPIATQSGGQLGLVKSSQDYGIQTLNTGVMYIATASEQKIKAGNDSFFPITPNNQHKAVFYGLAKVAGNSDQSSSSNAVGVYTDDAKLKIQQMLGLWTPKFYLKYTLDEDASNIGSDNLPFGDVELNIYEELVVSVYQSDTTQAAFASNDFVYLTVRDAVNNGYINVSGMYFKGTKKCSVMRIKRLPCAVTAELINDGSCYTSVFPRSLDYVDKIRWMALSAANGTVKAGTTVEAYITRLL